jgi:resuscitation-promoting factor RpfA
MRLRTLAASLLVSLMATVLVTSTLAAPANAVPMRTWQKLAKCESGARWHINTGNGYYGGLQISPSTWRASGGKKFAKMPHRASKKQQVRVAKVIKKRQGWGAWPSCSRKIGVR